MSDFNHALQINPNHLPALKLKAYALKLAARYGDALVAYNQIIAIEPNEAQVWMDKASVLRALGRKSEAQEVENRARSISRP